MRRATAVHISHSKRAAVDRSAPDCRHTRAPLSTAPPAHRERTHRAMLPSPLRSIAPNPTPTSSDSVDRSPGTSVAHRPTPMRSPTRNADSPSLTAPVTPPELTAQFLPAYETSVLTKNLFVSCAVKSVRHLVQ